MWTTLKQAGRVLLKSPGFVVPAVLSLALGIGGNVALFSLVNTVLLRPLPYPEPDQLVSIWKARFSSGGMSSSPVDFHAWKKGRSFSTMAAYLKQTVNLSGTGDPEQIEALRVTSDFFSLLGVPAPAIRESREAEAELAVLTADFRATTGDTFRINPSIVPLKAEIVGDAGSLLLPLFGAGSFVLLISCATLANLLLTRATVRSKEMAVRAALGASRKHLLSQLLTESVALALVGGALGLVFTHGLLKLILLTRSKGLPRIEEVGIDFSVLGFTLLLSVVTGILFGLGPALRSSRTDLDSTLKEDSRGTAGPARQWFQSSLIVAEVALSLVLLIGTGLLLNSFVRLINVEPGFRADHVLTMRLTLPTYAYRNSTQVIRFFQESVERVRHTPGVTSAGLTNHLPLARGVIHTAYTVPGHSEDSPVVGPTYFVSPDYLATMGTPMVQGRGFTERDCHTDSPPVVIVNRSFAKRFFPNTEAVGQHVNLKNEKLSGTIIGIVEDIKNGGLGDNQLWLSRPSVPTLFLPYALLPQSMYEPPWDLGRTMFLALRTTGDPRTMIEPIRRAIGTIDPMQPIADIRTMDDRVMDSVAVRRLGMLPVLIFAAIALTLAIGGIYGLVAYAVAQRTREVGIRMALGATRHHVLTLIMTKTIRLAILGIALGLAGGFWLSHTLSNQLYGISAADPATYGLVVLFLFAAVLFASYVPARRATAVDPTQALRYE